MAIYQFYIGGYTNILNQNSSYTNAPTQNGIALLEFDSCSGKAKILKTFFTYDNPSFLTLSGNNLYSVNELLQSGMISVYSVNSQNGDLQIKDSLQVSGMHTCHISTDSKNRFIYAACYSSGTIFGCKLKPDGSFGVLCTYLQFAGNSTNTVRQEGPHAHSVNISKDEKHLIVADLGTDRLMNYCINPITGELSPNSVQPFVSVRAGEGPRHMCYHPYNDILYVVTELYGNLLTYSINPDMFYLQQISSASLFMKQPFVADASAADIHITADGSFLFASIRGNNTLSSFSLADPRHPNLIEVYSTAGNCPRNFCITKDDQFLLVANQNSNYISIFECNPKNGTLSQEVSRVPFKQVSCIIQRCF